ncbi:type II toxin-antitoxin system HicA family toxin [Thalassospira indica]|uniref:Addiction module toxin, HicA family n=1 Tax=Thalassospira indica TaxID=1891279 RepID=A0ABM6XTZ3_9PROT|nr:type II toxin-antitoxin system HicA family toxin [Thalassospira indica]AXO13109.1 addiction module toxin, HicA family [Thalassospira indica]
MRSSDILFILEKSGWIHVRTTGSHWHFKKPNNPNLVTVVHPRKDNPIRYIKKLEKLSGVSLL